MLSLQVLLLTLLPHTMDTAFPSHILEDKMMMVHLLLMNAGLLVALIFLMLQMLITILTLILMFGLIQLQIQLE